MADLRFDEKNNQKKTGSIFASAFIATAVAMDEVLFNLPEASIVTNVMAVVETASGVATSTVDVTVGGTVVADELNVGATGTKLAAPAPVYFATGGEVKVVTGAVAADAAGRIKIVVTYIETELTTGEYTD